MAATLERLHWLAPETIQPAWFQVRRNIGWGGAAMDQLLASIRQDGIQEPLIVRMTVRADGSGYELLAGERRRQAALQLKLQEVPVIFKETVSERRAITISLLDNVRRQTLDVFEEGEGYALLVSKGMSEQAVAQNLGVGLERVQVALSLLKLDQPARDDLASRAEDAEQARQRLQAIAER